MEHTDAVLPTLALRHAVKVSAVIARVIAMIRLPVNVLRHLWVTLGLHQLHVRLHVVHIVVVYLGLTVLVQ